MQKKLSVICQEEEKQEYKKSYHKLCLNLKIDVKCFKQLKETVTSSHRLRSVAGTDLGAFDLDHANPIGIMEETILISARVDSENYRPVPNQDK